MPPLPWRLENHVARLQLGQLTAMVDLRQPNDGLVEVHLGAGRLAGAWLLGVATTSFSAGEEVRSPEKHLRGTDLVTAYEEPTSRPVRVDALWRAVSPMPSEKFVAAVELVVSVQTHLPESRPEVAVRSELSAAEAFRLVDAASARYRPLAPSPGAAAVIEPGEGLGCMLFRPPGVELSYAEMVHPADFQHHELTARPEDDGTICLSHHLFSDPLEKGVILRARVRGVFLPREDDTHVVAGCYAAFATAEPPLGT